MTIRLLYFDSSGKFFSPNSLQKHVQKAKTNLLIIAHARTGSSYLGKLFDAHPGVFYMYEPLFMLQGTTLRHSLLYEQAALKLLQDIFRCDFAEQDEFISFLSSLPLQRFSSKFLFEPFCTSFSSNGNQAHSRKYLCQKLTPRNVSHVCNNQAHTVVKILSHRIPLRVQTLHFLFKNVNNLKVIHLVRDPRAVANSISRIGWPTSDKFRLSTEASSLQLNIKRFCLSMIKELQFILEAEVTFPRRYCLQGYEALVQNPLREAQELYKFAGIPFSYKTRNWIIQGDDIAGIRARRSYPDSTGHPDSTSHPYTTGHPYSTVRTNARQLVDSWRTQLGRQGTKLVEQHCLPVLRLLGYHKVFSEKDLYGNSL